VTRGADDLLADLAEAVDAAAELVNLGKLRWDSERPLRLAGEAVIGAWATSPPSCQMRSSRQRLRFPGEKSRV
jgi:hypothetical protein